MVGGYFSERLKATSEKMFASVESIRFEIEDHFINKHFLSIFSENRRVLNLTMVRAWNDRITYLWFWHFVNSCDRNSSVFGMSWGLSYGIYHLDFPLDFFFWTLLIDHFWQFFGWKLTWSRFWTCQFLIFNINTISWFLGFLRFFKSFFRAVDKLILDLIKKKEVNYKVTF